MTENNSMDLRTGWMSGETGSWILIAAVVVFMLVVALLKLSKK
jgi:hypothetical protein